MREIAASELIINDDGTVFHLHLAPDEICDTILLVGDPGRTDMVASLFDEVTLSRVSREFSVRKGFYRGKEVMVVSTGIGTDNVDIVVNELDALANIDFKTRTVKKDLRSLTFIRMGTSGAVQPYLNIGDVVMSEVSIGIDSLARFYDAAESVCDRDMEDKFIEWMEWGEDLSRPYAVHADKTLVAKFSDMSKRGITISAPGFYAPQGRELRLRPRFKDMINQFEGFRYDGLSVNNIEMESSAIAVLSSMLGHHAITLCTIIAQRKDKNSNTSYHNIVKSMVARILDYI